MPRPPRLDPIDGWHHVMNRGVNRRPVFFHDSDRIEFGRLLGDIHARFGTETHAYCLLGNHYHAVLRCPTGDLSPAMQRLGAIYTRHVNDRVDRDGPIFRGRFHSRLITSSRYLANAIRYVHRNALDIDDVESVAEYRWSSHRTYLGLRRRPDWMVTDHVLNWFGGDIVAFDSFVRQRDHDASLSSDVRATDLLGAIDFILGQRCDDMRRARSQRRAIALTLGQHMLDDEQVALRAALGLNDSSALKTATWRAQRAAGNSDTIELVGAVRQLLATEFQ